MPAGRHDVCRIAPRLVAAGVDLVDVSAGMYETNWWITQPMEMPQGVLSKSALPVRRRGTSRGGSSSVESA